MKYKEFVYTGEPISELNEKEYTMFFMNIQKAILLSLEKRNILTSLQREQCLLKLEKQYKSKGEYSYVNKEI